MKESLNICIIFQEFTPYTNWGRVSIYYKELVDCISQIGHKITIISRYTPGAPSVEELSE